MEELLGTLVTPPPTTERSVVSADATRRIPPESLLFYSAARYDSPTALTLATHIQQLDAEDEDALGRGIAKSLPRSWRDL